MLFYYNDLIYCNNLFKYTSFCANVCDIIFLDVFLYCSIALARVYFVYDELYRNVTKRLTSYGYNIENIEEICKMKSLKKKLILIILILVIISSVATVVVGIHQSFKVNDEIIDTMMNDRLDCSNDMLKVYLEEEFGILSLNSDNELVDENNKVISGNYEYIDEFSKDMNLLATVFQKKVMIMLE